MKKLFFTNALRLSILLAFAALLNAATTVCQASEPKLLFSWDFNSDADVKEWGLANFARQNADEGTFKLKPTNWDPFVVSPHFMLKPQQGQYVEIRMRSTSFGHGEIFFASSDEGKYNGFSQDKTASWRIQHDGKFHTYQIMPAWLREPQIIKIRVDLGTPSEKDIENGAETEIDYIRIYDLNLADAETSNRSVWDGDDLVQLLNDDDEKTNVWQSKIAAIDPKKVGSFLWLVWNVDKSALESNVPLPRATVSFLINEGTGNISLDVPLFNVATSKRSFYEKNVDLSALPGWGTNVFRWEISTPKGYELKIVRFDDKPSGAGVLETQEARQLALSRLSGGRAEIQIEGIARNCGGQTLRQFYAKADPNLKSVALQKVVVDPLLGFNPSGDRLTTFSSDASIDQTEWNGKIANDKIAFPEELRLNPGEAVRFVATYEYSSSGSFAQPFSLFAESESARAGADWSPRVVVLPESKLPQNASYVPTPQPVASEYEIGAYYFPGWSKRAGWDKIANSAPIRQPLLGYYDEGNPEVVDWQIKWATENGIKFFLVDWYWYHGDVRLEHWIKAFQKAKYRSSFKWAVMWANHTGAGTHSSEDWKTVTKYWLDNYFNTPEYYTIDGKPVVMIWDQSIVDGDMIAEAAKEGIKLKPGEGCKRAFDICRKMCVDAGYPGVYFIAMKWPERATDAKTIQNLANASFDATTIYHFMYPGEKLENERLYSFDSVVDASKPNWEAREKTGILPFIPNISTGWDSRPWHGFRSTIVYDRNVESFKRLLNDAKSFADENGVKRLVLGPVNEWGEGSYIEPNLEFGFGMYEAIRSVFAKEPQGGFPTNYAPYEIGLGPYDLPVDQELKPEDHF